MGLEVAATVSAISAVGGLAMNVMGGKKQTEAASDASEASQKAEEARKQQMLLESARNERETIRKMMLARSAAVDAGQSQGASYGSGVAGGIASITGQGNSALNYNMRATDIGATIFDANKDYAAAQKTAAIGSGMSRLGSVFTGNATQIGKIAASGASLFSNTSNGGWQTDVYAGS